MLQLLPKNLAATNLPVQRGFAVDAPEIWTRSVQYSRAAFQPFLDRSFYVAAVVQRFAEDGTCVRLGLKRPVDDLGVVRLKLGGGALECDVRSGPV